jgi:2-keto-4-pentenoate hydratase/2-oxohepta-3-ene-1,7-dioic acid hydratase in catechol pathway
MKLASYQIAGNASYGVIVGDGIVDLGRRLAPRYPDLRSLLDGGELDAAARAIRGASADVLTSQVTWLPVIPNPDKILCIGLNYRAHVEEVGRPLEQHPVVFIRLASSQVGHLQPMVRPKISDKFDYEGELAVVIGQRGRHIAPQNAFEHVAGYSIYNEGSIRDWQRHTHQFTPGKNFFRSGAFGPFLVTADEIPDPTKLRLTTRLNGQVMQDDSVDQLLFPIETLISYISEFTELVPGDVIVTGTPSGVGAARKPPVWLKPGDEVDVEVSTIGVLRNSIVAEA